MLDDCDLGYWVSEADTPPSRYVAAPMAAVRLLEADVVHVSLPRRTVHNRDEPKAWLAKVEGPLGSGLRSGSISPLAKEH
jgi:hypothetical protein